MLEMSTSESAVTTAASPDEPKRILFVDDEPSLLDGLRDALRPLRRRRKMTFVPGDEEALDVLRHEPQDVVVSDLRMPSMDGARRSEPPRGKRLRAAVGAPGLPRADRRPASGDARVSEIAGIVEQDMAIAAKVLALANSAYVGRSQPVTRVTDAVVYLGLEAQQVEKP